jgi:hypothetical protein
VVVVRKLVKGDTKQEVQRKLNSLPKDWKPISEIKEDYSGLGYYDIRWVCVVEAEDKPHKKRSHWGNF